MEDMIAVIETIAIAPINCIPNCSADPVEKSPFFLSNNPVAMIPQNDINP